MNITFLNLICVLGVTNYAVLGTCSVLEDVGLSFCPEAKGEEVSEWVMSSVFHLSLPNSKLINK